MANRYPGIVRLVWDLLSRFPASTLLLSFDAAIGHQVTPLPAIHIMPSLPQSQSLLPQGKPKQIIAVLYPSIAHNADGAAAGLQCPG